MDLRGARLIRKNFLLAISDYGHPTIRTKRRVIHVAQRSEQESDARHINITIIAPQEVKGNYNCRQAHSPIYYHSHLLAHREACEESKLPNRATSTSL